MTDEERNLILGGFSKEALLASNKLTAILVEQSKDMSATARDAIQEALAEIRQLVRVVAALVGTVER